MTLALLIAVSAWSAAVLLAGRLLRRPRRVICLVASAPSHVRRRGRRGVVLVAVTGLATVAHPLLGLAALCAQIVVHRWRRMRVARLEAARTSVALPDLLELIAAGIAAGCSARQAFLSSVEIAPASLRPACERLRQRLRRGERFADALQHLASDVGEAARPMVTALRAHERDGVPLQPTLERIAADARRQRRQQAETAIRRLPVQLSVPLVTCTLTAFAVLTVVPLGAATLRSLQGQLPSTAPRVAPAGPASALQRPNAFQLPRRVHHDCRSRPPPCPRLPRRQPMAQTRPAARPRRPGHG